MSFINKVGCGISSFGICALLIGCQPQSNEQPTGETLRPVRTILVEPTAEGPYKEFTAVVDASQKVDLAFKISGRMVEMLTNSGDPVQEGQVIAKLDDTDIKVELAEAQSSFNKALSDFNRGRDLIKTNSISQADFDQLQAQYNSANAQLTNSKNRLEYTNLVATFDGVIAQRYAENFQEVKAQEPIVALHDLHNINFKVDVPESIMINIKPDERNPQVTAIFESIPDQTFDLTFKEVNTQADDVTKTYQVVFTMPNSPEHSILPGMSARVRVIRGAGAVALANFYVPDHAVLKDASGNYVFTVSAAEEGKGVISRRNVVIGDITAWGIEIFSGLEGGEHLVIAGMSKVNDGMIVKFEN
jgi:RND family efflux transporter MFP subunit